MKILSLLTVTACLIGSAKPSPAQQPWPISLEAVIGGTVGRSDNESAFCGDRAGPFFDILASGRLHPADRGGLVVALNATGHFINTYQIGCGFEEPSQENLDYFPGQGGFFGLAGWENRSTRLRVVTGPGAVGYQDTFAWIARVDVATPPAQHLSVIATLSAMMVPNWEGDSFSYFGLGIGLRIR